MLFLSASDFEGKLFPALVTFSADSSIHVRLATVKQLCNAAKIVTQRPLVERIDTQFEQLLGHNGHDILAEVLRQFTQLIPSSSASFRDMCILPKLIKAVEVNNANENREQRYEACRLVIDAYRAFNGCVITEETIQLYILPGLRLMQGNAAALEPSQVNIINRMITDMERAVGALPIPKRQGTR
jgi:hypothetical protein